MDSTTHDLSHLLIELGLVVIGLAILARIASRWGFSAIPLYLLAGLAFGNGGLAPLKVSAGFIHIGAEIGVLLLLFMLGVEYTGRELVDNLRGGFPAAVVDLALNFTPGLIAGLLLRWQPLAAVLLGGVSYVSSSGVIAKVLADLRRLENPETPAVLSILVLEDLAMAVYLPLVAVLLAGGGPAKIALSVSLAIATVFLVLVVAVRYGQPLSRFVVHESDEIVLLTMFGAVLLVAGVSQRLQVSAAIGAFLVGIAVSGPMAQQTHRLLAPVRDLFAATFFFFFGLQIDPATLPSALPTAVLLGAATAVTKVLTGYFAARRSGVDRPGRLRAGMALVARGEFSIVIAGLGSVLEPQLGPLSAAYVLFLAVLGPILTRAAK
ncbi:MAG: cation:proton antiporter [Candidatus Acidiferrales bacterium]